MNTKALGMLSSLLAVALISGGAEAAVSSKTFTLSSGQPVPAGQFEAVGRVPGCTATLITERLVLTAAHCVCPSGDNALNCNTRTTFTLTDVRPAANPATRTDVAIGGSVIVHPNYTKAGWLRSDYALVVLDRPVWQLATGIQPIPVADPAHAVRAGETVTLIGYGGTGAGCDENALGKLYLPLPVTEVVPDAIRFAYAGDHVCPGDSGGPVLSGAGFLVGVASWSDFRVESTYRPAWEVFDWINMARVTYDPAAPSEGKVVVAGTSRDLDAYRGAAQYALKPGAQDVAGMAIAGSNDVVYVWYLDGTVSAGDSRDLTSRRAPYPYTLPPGKTPADIVDVAIAGSDDHVYAWYLDGTVSSGTSSDLDAYRPPQPYAVPPGRTPADIVGIGISRGDRVFAWYADGTVSSGTTRDLDAATPPQQVSMPPERTAAHIMATGIAGSDDHVYTWFKPYLR